MYVLHWCLLTCLKAEPEMKIPPVPVKRSVAVLLATELAAEVEMVLEPASSATSRLADTEPPITMPVSPVIETEPALLVNELPLVVFTVL